MSGTTHYFDRSMNGIFTITDGIATIEDGILTCESVNTDLIKSNVNNSVNIYTELSIVDIKIGNSNSYQRIGDILIFGSTITGAFGNYNLTSPISADNPSLDFFFLDNMENKNIYIGSNQTTGYLVIGNRLEAATPGVFDLLTLSDGINIGYNDTQVGIGNMYIRNNKIEPIVYNSLIQIGTTISPVKISNIKIEGSIINAVSGTIKFINTIDSFDNTLFNLIPTSNNITIGNIGTSVDMANLNFRNNTIKNVTTNGPISIGTSSNINTIANIQISNSIITATSGVLTLADSISNENPSSTLNLFNNHMGIITAFASCTNNINLGSVSTQSYFFNGVAISTPYTVRNTYPGTTLSFYNNQTASVSLFTSCTNNITFSTSICPLVAIGSNILSEPSIVRAKTTTNLSLFSTHTANISLGSATVPLTKIDGLALTVPNSIQVNNPGSSSAIFVNQTAGSLNVGDNIPTIRIGGTPSTVVLSQNVNVTGTLSREGVQVPKLYSQSNVTNLLLGSNSLVYNIISFTYTQSQPPTFSGSNGDYSQNNLFQITGITPIFFNGIIDLVPTGTINRVRMFYTIPSGALLNRHNISCTYI